MKGQLDSFYVELKGIKMVLDKLLTKQNSQVFDKLCGKCNDLFANFNSKITVERAVSEGMVSDCITFLKELLNVCNKLKDYKMYLIEVISQNIGHFQQQEASQSVSPNFPTEVNGTNNVWSFEKTHKLELANNDTRNAA